jgi:tRNA threonylcarbamoyladenosine biosynthesis protein TsaE
MIYFDNHMKKEIFTTTSDIQTKKLGEILASELLGGEIICLSGDLGAGKTTFTQGVLKGLKVGGPYTSPTFAIMKHYKINFKFKILNLKLMNIYHIDAYRVNSKDLLELGFKDFAGKENSVTIIEWPEKVKKIIPTSAVWINFEWLSDKERKLTLSQKKDR